ncbi:hypothetical protein J2R76_007125 [Bradyrhizobium sp. USDA 4532]|nr:hypothetical protein [Bradyrhizobium sp. USDA 4545]MCP1923534.1 hypothetical protein [Bradyrhizobium sp. USDA 4532]
MEDAIEIDRVELRVVEARQFFGAPGGELEVIPLPKARNFDAAGKWIDTDHAAVRTDQSGDEFRKPAGSRPDVEHVLAGLDGERPDQELAVAKLNESRFIIGAGELRGIVFKADVAGSSRHFERSIVARRASTSGACAASDSMSAAVK